MGLIRGTLFTVIAILLFVSLLSMNTFWTISKSLEYEVLQPQLVPITTDIEQIGISRGLDASLPIMQYYCLNNTEFIYSLEETTIEIPCSKINEGAQEIINYLILDMVEKNYYKEYDCSFWECGMTPPYHLISQKAQDYWSEWFYLSLILSIVLAVGSLFVMENRRGYPFILGGLLIISSLIFAKIEWLFSFLGKWELVSFVELFFSKAYTVFLINFLLGVVLILVGIALKFLGLGQFLNNVFSIKKKG